MEYSKIIAVTGLPGLYEIISSKTDGAIVRSLEDNATKFVSSRVHNFSHLESIEIYTVRDNVNLVDILLAMQKASSQLPDVKDNAAVKKYFESVYPDLDFVRVYASDMKKMVKWFEVLDKHKVEIKLTEPPVEEEMPVAKEPLKKEEPKKDEPAKKSAKKKEMPEVVEEETKKPVKASTAKTPKTAKTETSKPKEKAKAEPTKSKEQKETKKKDSKESKTKESKAEAPKKKAASKKK